MLRFGILRLSMTLYILGYSTKQLSVILAANEVLRFQILQILLKFSQQIKAFQILIIHRI